MACAFAGFAGAAVIAASICSVRHFAAAIDNP
jgi:hypothetical protein